MTPDTALDRLHRAGWTVGEVRCGSTWLVSGHNGENLIRDEVSRAAYNRSVPNHRCS
jgi:hypothetical protein